MSPRPARPAACGNQRDPILKERLFGLTNAEGNHGEDVKEYYFYVDNLPTHSYERYLYKYPQAEFPYDDLVAVNRARSRQEMEYELIDTGVFEDGRYFDVEVEHAKNGPEDIRVPHHRAQSLRPGRRAARPAHPVVPQHVVLEPGEPKPRIARAASGYPVARAEHEEGSACSICTLNRRPACSSAKTRRTRRGRSAPAGDPLPQGRHRRPPAARRRHRQPLRRGNQGGGGGPALGAGRRAGRGAGPAHPGGTGGAQRAFDGAGELIARRRAEADDFYEAITPPSVPDDAKAVMRQALAGMLWSKQCYYFDVDRWLRERHLHPLRSPAWRGSRTSPGSTCSTMTSCPCPTNGSSPGTPPGTWPSIASRWPWLTPNSRKARST